MNRKYKIGLIFTIIFLTAIVFSATYAYFIVSATNNFGSRTISTSLGALGSVSLKAGNNLKLDLTTQDMAGNETDKTYYASSSGATETPTTEAIATAQAIGTGIFQCSYKIKVEDKSTKSMYTAFQNMSTKSANQIILTVNGKDYDFNTANLFPLTITGKFSNLVAGDNQNITASFKITNKADINQIELADTNISLNFTTEELNCTVSNGKWSGAEVLANSGELWQSDLEGDGYRYIGTNPNNYICFGTTNKDDCANNTDAYMYRIIGVFPDSEGNQHMKLIKKEALNTAMQWDDSKTEVNWGDSKLYKSINDTEKSTVYLKNPTYMPSGWSERIANWTWTAVNSLVINGGIFYSDTSSENIYLHELNKSGKPNNTGEWTYPKAQIGLMYLSDYLLSLGEEALELIPSKDSYKLQTGWMHISRNDTNESYEWTLARYGDFYGTPNAWTIYTDGKIFGNNEEIYHRVRPVFYLNQFQEIQSGDGTIDNPYILK